MERKNRWVFEDMKSFCDTYLSAWQLQLQLCVVPFYFNQLRIIDHTSSWYFHPQILTNPLHPTRHTFDIRRITIFRTIPLSLASAHSSIYPWNLILTNEKYVAFNVVFFQLLSKVFEWICMENDEQNGSGMEMIRVTGFSKHLHWQSSRNSSFGKVVGCRHCHREVECTDSNYLPPSAACSSDMSHLMNGFNSNRM